MYLRPLLAQAGVAHAETSSGEDHLAVGMTLEFIAGSVRVQIKTGTKATKQGRQPHRAGDRSPESEVVRCASPGVPGVRPPGEIDADGVD